VSDTLRCETCERSVPRAETIRRETMADLDPTKWQSLCCPDCGRTLKTVFVARERLE
jgi:NAD-dependent SIR2 family protein deacetylase